LGKFSEADPYLAWLCENVDFENVEQKLSVFANKNYKNNKVNLEKRKKKKKKVKSGN
jgi:hypothetical protein